MGRGSETQLQMGGILNDLIERGHSGGGILFLPPSSTLTQN